jgi:hypothetical protein
MPALKPHVVDNLKNICTASTAASNCRTNTPPNFNKDVNQFGKGLLRRQSADKSAARTPYCQRLCALVATHSIFLEAQTECGLLDWMRGYSRNMEAVSSVWVAYAR